MTVKKPPSSLSRPANSYHRARDITSRGHNAKDCTNELMDFRKIKIKTSVKIDVGHWEKSTNAVNDAVRSTCKEI